MKKTVMKKYAQLIAVTGANVQKGQEVMINSSVETAEFARMVAEECYRAGAKKVIVEWSYQPLEKTNYRYRSIKTLSTIEKWEIERLEHRATVLPAMIYLESEDPDGLAGVNQQKVAKARQARYPIIKPFRDRMENRYQWVIAAVPGEKWAKKMFPKLSRHQAVEKLWEAILYTSRADGEDPINDWKKHNANLAEKCRYLNSLGIDELIYHSSNGTDFRVGLIPDVDFLGGGETSLQGVYYNPNMPTEEVFTSPMRGKAEGTVVATRPLSYQGQLIENFSVRFENGKAVEVHAEKNEELLRQMISMDEGAAYLGECSLVPYDSPIQNSGLTFYNTLFDENACCHLALGMGFVNCVRDFDKYTLEECREKGINDSMIHVDFMIGSADLDIDAKTRDGRTVAIFRNGNWAF
ncbi:MAG: aminopeptidase [Eubacteriales bacterium]|nr:aminopeptidase [Clostridiales bacterium]MDD7595604.1 aminopeptidase [Clostridiales bacterium]MDY4887269.1 aminopeptidase [Eubacteriales bacterium]MDY5860472.1 aminopeptidase [Eubacteriales bacterium]